LRIPNHAAIGSWLSHGNMISNYSYQAGQVSGRLHCASIREYCRRVPDATFSIWSHQAGDRDDHVDEKD
jgi:hypothetical protein